MNGGSTTTSESASVGVSTICSPVGGICTTGAGPIGVGVRQHSELISSSDDSVLDTTVPPPTPVTSSIAITSPNSHNHNLNINNNDGNNTNIIIPNGGKPIPILSSSSSSHDGCPSNLAIIGQTSATAGTSSSHQMFSVGDKVRVDVGLDVFKQMQEGHGGWNFKMADVKFL